MSKSRKLAFTLVEILIVIAILGLLLGILVPVVKRAMDKAKEAAVQTQIQKLSMGLETFKLDFGYYPKSVPEGVAGTYLGVNAPDNRQGITADYPIQGFHRLAFALAGRDLLGCPARRGENATGLQATSDRGPDSFTGWFYSGDTTDNGTAGGRWRNATQWDADHKTPRKGPYVNPDDFTVVQDKSAAGAGNTYLPVIADRLASSKDNIANKADYKTRSTILYFAASPRGTRIDNAPGTGGTSWDNQVYYIQDNYLVTCGGTSPSSSEQTAFYKFILDPRATVGTGPAAVNQPHNRDTYLLISPGLDGKYFTDDDIRNWAN